MRGAVKRHRLSKREARRLLEEIREAYPGFRVDNVSSVEVALIKDPRIEVYLINGTPCFYKEGERLVPLLSCLFKMGHEWLPRVYVDEGATRALARGADLMIPGVTRVEGHFMQGDVVVVVDEASGKPVMVGEALVDSEVLRGQTGSRRGKAVKKIHRIGDKLWKATWHA